jgi:hypothetical protein
LAGFSPVLPAFIDIAKVKLAHKEYVESIEQKNGQRRRLFKLVLLFAFAG